jgi:curli production assembly/transport component CsgG
MKSFCILLSIILTSCSTIEKRTFPSGKPNEFLEERAQHELKSVDPPARGEPLVVAVYSFRDLTGQKKSSDMGMSLSSIVTQGAEAYLIKSLQETGNGTWFRVVERIGIDNLIRERQIILSERQKANAPDILAPMLFAGVIIEGGIVGYETNYESGGEGARYLGIGASAEYRRDKVIISLRMVSVSTGEILISVLVEKDILSVRRGIDSFLIFDISSRAFETEIGMAKNESINKALKWAINEGILILIKDGKKLKYFQ